MKIISPLALAVCAFFAAASAQAKTSLSSAVDAAIACRSLADDAARLSCLDAAAAKLAEARAPAAAESASASAEFGLSGGAKSPTANAAEMTARSPEQEIADFGAEAVPSLRDARADEQLHEISANATMSMNSRKVATLYLDNGQVWRQLNSDSYSLPYPKDDATYKVVVKRTSFGNYIAYVGDYRRSIRVRRIK